MFSWFGKVSYSPHTRLWEFARYLKDGYLMASRCSHCGYTSFPPRTDCPQCLGDEFAYFEISGEGTVVTYTRIDAAPAGFEDITPYVIGVVDLAETGRLLAWFGDSIPEEEIAIGIPVQVVPMIFEDVPEIKVYYSLEKPGTSWVKSEAR